MEDVNLMRGTLGPINRQVFVPQGYQFFFSGPKDFVC